MDQEMLDLLARLRDESQRSNVTDEELAALRASIAERVADVDIAHATAEDIELLDEAAQIMEVVRAETETRETAAAERNAAAADLIARIGITAEPTAEQIVEAEAEVAEAEAAAAAEAANAEVHASREVVDTAEVPAAEPVAAAAVERQPGDGLRGAPNRLPSISRLASRRPERARPQPTATMGTERRAPVLTAAADLPGLGAGIATEIDPWARAVESRINAIRKAQTPGSDGEQIYFGSVRADYPEERTLTDNDAENQRKIDAVASPQALAASGGICGPVAVDYNVMNLAVNDRPVAQSMAQFGAARGGIRFILPHTLAQVTADAPAAIWTAANDANPTNPTAKPHATFTCQAVQEVYVDAVTSIVQFGNFQARYFPEQVTQYMQTVDAVHSRLGDATLLGAMTAGSTVVNADNYELGAARDLLATIDRAAAAMRYRHRLAPDTPLRVVYPEWLEDMVRADLARQLPGDSGGSSERLAIADAEIARFFAVRNINTSSVLDSPTGAATLQGWGIQPAGPLLPWPTTTTIWLFPEGSWTFLDGGELNLGMVRDSVLNRTNDFQFFTETFEKAVFRGHESLALNLRIAPTGASAGTVATTPGGSTYTVGS